MLFVGWVSSHLGAKRTLVIGLAIIVIFAALAGTSGSINGIVGFRANWGLGNALFIATSLAVIVASASGGFGGAIILYETALGLGITVGPLLSGELGGISWRAPFFTMLGYAPYPRELNAHELGLVFTGWGLLVAAFSVFSAPRLQAWFGTAPCCTPTCSASASSWLGRILPRM